MDEKEYKEFSEMLDKNGLKGVSLDDKNKEYIKRYVKEKTEMFKEEYGDEGMLMPLFFLIGKWFGDPEKLDDYKDGK